MLFYVSIEYAISFRCSVFSLKNTDFPEPLGFSIKTKGISDAHLAHLKPSNTNVDFRGAGKAHHQPTGQFVKAVFSALQVLGLILCCYGAEDINDVSSN